MMSEKELTVTGVIVNYNAGDVLRASALSWFQAAPEAALIIVDNASSDGSADFVAELEEKYPVRVIWNPKNAGFSVAANQGFRVADTELVLLLNPDCVLQNGALAEMARTLQKNADVGMVGPLLLHPDGTEQAGGRRAVPTPWRSFVRAFGLARFSRRWPKLYQDFYLHKEPLPDHPVEVEAISGACMLVKREAFEDVGLLDEEYFMHCEDLDWCMRFRQAGWRILFVPSAPALHYKGACSHRRPFFVEWHKHKGMVRFYGKFFRHQYPGGLMWLVILGVWLRFGMVATYYAIGFLRGQGGAERG